MVSRSGFDFLKDKISDGTNLFQNIASHFNDKQKEPDYDTTQIKDPITSERDSFNDSLKLENWVNNTTYPKEKYEQALKVFKDPLKYMDHSANSSNRSQDKDASEADDAKVPWPDR